jgi:hypothetical protein
MQEQCAEVGKAFHKSCAIAPHVMAYVIGAPGSNAGGRRAAAIYSLIESAKLNGLNPQHYLADVVAALPTIRRGALLNSCPGTGNRSTLPALPPELARSPNAYADTLRPATPKRCCPRSGCTGLISYRVHRATRLALLDQPDQLADRAEHLGFRIPIGSLDRLDGRAQVFDARNDIAHDKPRRRIFGPQGDG